MAIEYREFDADGMVHIKAGETVLGIVPIWVEGINFPVWCVQVQVPGKVIDFMAEKEKRNYDK